MDTMVMANVAAVVICLVLCFLFFLLIRVVVCWYFHINEHIVIQKDQRVILQGLLDLAIRQEAARRALEQVDAESTDSPPQ